MVTDTQFEALLRRKDAQAAALSGRDAPLPPASSDKTREALEAHSAAIERAYAKTAVLVPSEREPAPAPARSYANDFQVRVGELVLPASHLLVRLLLNERGPALVAEIAKVSPSLAEELLSHLREY